MLSLLLLFKDQKTLKNLKDKFPQSDIMFVCNKVDVCDKAREFDDDDDDDDDDHDEDNDDDDDDDDDGHDDDDDDAGKVQAVNKGEKVFGQLIKKEFVSGDMESCLFFHAISAKKVREERKTGTLTEFTENFKRFESSLKEQDRKSVV